MSGEFLGASQLDALRELVNISMGRAGRSIAELCHREVALQVVELQLRAAGEAGAAGPLAGEACLRVVQRFGGGLEGAAVLAFSRPVAARLARLLLGKPAGDDLLDDLEQSALLELGNIVIGAAVGRMAAAMEEPTTYDLPHIEPRPASAGRDFFSDLSQGVAVRTLVIRAAFALPEETIALHLALILPEARLLRVVEALERLLTA